MPATWPSLLGVKQGCRDADAAELEAACVQPSHDFHSIDEMYVHIELLPHSSHLNAIAFYIWQPARRVS